MGNIKWKLGRFTVGQSVVQSLAYDEILYEVSVLRLQFNLRGDCTIWGISDHFLEVTLDKNFRSEFTWYKAIIHPTISPGQEPELVFGGFVKE